MRLREGGGRLRKMGKEMWWKKEKEKGGGEERGEEGEGEGGMMGRCEGEVEIGWDGRDGVVKREE